MHHLKLVKLLYLADRAFAEQTGATISGDKYFSMKHGPVGSQSLDLLNGNEEGTPDQNYWDQWISDKEDHKVSLRESVSLTREHLDHLSNQELAILDSVWTSYGELDRFALAELTHAICPEWQDPGENRGRVPIPEANMLEQVGKLDAPDAELATEARDLKRLLRIV